MAQTFWLGDVGTREAALVVFGRGEASVRDVIEINPGPTKKAPLAHLGNEAGLDASPGTSAVTQCRI